MLHEKMLRVQHLTHWDTTTDYSLRATFCTCSPNDQVEFAVPGGFGRIRGRGGPSSGSSGGLPVATPAPGGGDGGMPYVVGAAGAPVAVPVTSVQAVSCM
jgi:hypothetical protein